MSNWVRGGGREGAKSLHFAYYHRRVRVTGQRYDEVSQVVHFSNKGVPRLHLANSCVLILILPTFSEYLAVFLKGQDT